MAQKPQDEEDRSPVRRASGESQTELRSWQRLAGVGFEFIVAVLLFGWIGHFADGKVGTDPWLMITGFGIGFAVGLYLLIRQANQSFHD